MKYIIIGFMFFCHSSCVQASQAEQIFVMHGMLDSAWGGGPSEYSQTTQQKYFIEQAGIGEFHNTFVGISFGSRTLSGVEPENAILIMTLTDYNDLQNIQSFQIIGGDARLGLLEYEDGL